MNFLADCKHFIRALSRVHKAMHYRLRENNGEEIDKKLQKSFSIAETYAFKLISQDNLMKNHDYTCNCEIPLCHQLQFLFLYNFTTFA